MTTVDVVFVFLCSVEIYKYVFEVKDIVSCTYNLCYMVFFIANTSKDAIFMFKGVIRNVLHCIEALMLVTDIDYTGICYFTYLH